MLTLTVQSVAPAAWVTRRVERHAHLAVRARLPVSLLMEVIYPYPAFARGLRSALRRLS
jgi:hypothetical protein